MFSKTILDKLPSAPEINMMELHYLRIIANLAREAVKKKSSFTSDPTTKAFSPTYTPPPLPFFFSFF